MRIGFVSTYPPIECGIATYTSYLNNALRKQGNETFVVSQTGAQGQNIFPVYSIYDSDMATSIFNASVSLTPDVMHIQHEFGLYGDQQGVQVIELILRYKLAGVPVITTFHTVNSAMDKNTKLIQRLILIESSAVIVHDELQKKILVKHFGMADKIHVIPHGIREIPCIPDAKKKLEIEGKKVILLCGYFRPSKCFHKIVNIMPEICSKMDNACLLMAGKTRRVEYSKYRSMLFECINHSPVADKIIVLRGQFPQHTFDTIVSAADVMALPYIAGAQSGIMAQSFAFHKPVVTSSLPAFKRLVKASKGGLVCKSEKDYAKNILKILQDDELRHKLKDNIKNYVEQDLKWSKAAEKHIDVYHSVINVPYGNAKYVYFPEE